MRKALHAIWRYFVDMNSENGGGVSIKRNIVWGVATLLVFSEVFPLVALYILILRQPDRDMLITVFQFLCWFFVTVDAVIILLALRITSLEKLNALASTVLGRGGGDQPNGGRPQMVNPVPMPEKQSTMPVFDAPPPPDWPSNPPKPHDEGITI